MLCSLLSDGQTVRTDTKVNTEDTLSAFQEFFLQLIIKDRSNKNNVYYCYQVQDIVYINDSEIATCSDVVARDSADKSIMAWDTRTGGILSNQIYQVRI